MLQSMGAECQHGNCVALVTGKMRVFAKDSVPYHYRMWVSLLYVMERVSQFQLLGVVRKCD
jgi:hypothetical protein